MRRILTVVPSLGIGGTERCAVTFALAYNRLNQDSRVWAFQGGSRRQQLTSRDIRTHIGRDRPRWDWDWVPDVVHLHSNGMCREDVLQLKSMYPGVIIVLQNVFAHPTPYDDLLDINFQLSRDCLEKYYVRGGKRPSTVIPNPIDPSPFFRDSGAAAHLRIELGLSQSTFVVTRVGQPITYKWSPMLLLAFDRVCSRGIDANLVLVGCPQDVIRQIQRSPWAHQIHVIPETLNDSQLRAVYSATDLFAHAAAQGESFGYVLVEAMLCGAPTLTLATPRADNSQGEVVGRYGYIAESSHAFKKIMMAGAQGTLPLVPYPDSRNSMIARYEDIRVADNALGVMESLMNGNALDITQISRDEFGAWRRRWDRWLHWSAPKFSNGAWRWIPHQIATKFRRKRAA